MKHENMKHETTSCQQLIIHHPRIESQSFTLLHWLHQTWSLFIHLFFCFFFFGSSFVFVFVFAFVFVFVFVFVGLAEIMPITQGS